MNNNPLNEISTNDSPTQSPSKNKKHFELKSIIPVFSSFNKGSTNKIISSKENINISNIEEGKILALNSNKKRKRRIFKKIIKKKSKCLLLDFDFILRNIIVKDNTFEMDKKPIQELLKKKRLDLNDEVNNGKNIIMKKNNLINQNNYLKYSNNIGSNPFKIQEEKKVNQNLLSRAFNELSDNFFNDNKIEVRFPHLILIYRLMKKQMMMHI